MLTIINANIITPMRIIPGGSLTLEGGRITQVRDTSSSKLNGEVIDAQGLYLSPGFIDIHIHGGGGADFMDNELEGFVQIAQTHAKFGTTAMLPTTLTGEPAKLLEVFAVYQEALSLDYSGADFLGLHLEGPYFAMNQRGAQDPRFIRNPNPEEYIPLLDRYGHLIRRWSAAPELPGALEFGRELRSRGILAALAHTDAVYEDILKGVESGFRLATHLYSGMSGMTRKNAYRYAGAIESCLLLDEIDAEIIADGVHLPEPFLKLICKTKGIERVILITDAMRGAGMPEGKSILGSKDDGLEVIIENGVAKLPDRSSFAGSVATADQLVRVMMNVAGQTLMDAVRMLTLNPARLLSLEHERGIIAQGMRADLLLFDDAINIKQTIVAGRTVYSTL
ncbi:N-acetylglucosamine-6-phosphate deacetylase [Sphingobacterium sp. JB170]|uniref:N-acetylglucosamine-6-phosphate deacetylase n=1 Tax=Sphingobacterium sp. JB170 TaxID=1434842 RepID=UPI00097F4B0A|nr:N-acetylglucosamine-6-phosphate deacetylase [Sphingobacterium sp. JB170]SJN47664.1 N-acetylglucosamine-6-phosphate deacetylase [Sphingobacterium sp. JB170]